MKEREGKEEKIASETGLNALKSHLSGLYSKNKNFEDNPPPAATLYAGEEDLKWGCEVGGFNNDRIYRI